ncbi:hypothetical protein LJC24_04580 [Desulfococcaceae bacterium OttesenSCG-928-F15]|nr:hypothetical protein [Desulfococcaceae bacterium OttesenSCG-928-F15]
MKPTDQNDMLSQDTILVRRLRWLMGGRALLGFFVLAFSAASQYWGFPFLFDFHAWSFYLVASLILAFSLIYGVWYYTAKHFFLFTSVQFALDLFFVTLLVWITGGYESLLTFLYLLVIVNASIFFSRKGTLFVAVFAAIFFAWFVYFEYYGLLPFLDNNMSLLVEGKPLQGRVAGFTVITHVLTASVAFLAVGFLTGFLSVQTRKAKDQVRSMTVHMRQIEGLAAAGKVAAGLAHEIKNPLAVMRGAIELLETEEFHDEDATRLMRIVRRESDRLSNLLTEFLFFARPGRGYPEQLELESFIRDYVQTSVFKNEDDVEYVLNLRPNTWVEVDPDRFRQVLSNLLFNAIEAIEGDGTISITMDVGKDQVARIFIRDTGAGIPPERLSSVFDPFYTTKPYGTGLGLPIVVSILDAIGGYLTVESFPGKGSTFQIQLLTIPSPQGDGEKPAGNSEKKAETSRSDQVPKKEKTPAADQDEQLGIKIQPRD